MKYIYWTALLVILSLFIIYRIKKTKKHSHSSTTNQNDNIKDSEYNQQENTIENNKNISQEDSVVTLTQEEVDDFVRQEINRRATGIEKNQGIDYFDVSDVSDDFGYFDYLFREVAEIIVETQHVSTSLLQRKLRLGYNRTVRIIDQLERTGIVGPFDWNKSREVLIKNKVDLDNVLSKIGFDNPKKREYFEKNILPFKVDYIENKVNEYIENKIKEQLRQEILDKEKKKALRKRKEGLKKEVIKDLSESGLINTEDYLVKKREPIPQDVQDKVWNRDNGKCVKCGSQENLEFDHIVPFSKGGSNTYRNLQLLCQKCNREKSDNIG